MEFLIKLIQQRSGILSIVLVSLFAFIFSGIAIYSAYEQDKGLRILIKHPFTVSAAIYNVRKEIFAMQVHTGRLEAYHSPEDVAIVRKRIEIAAEQITSELAYIVKYYLGPAEQALLVKKNLQKAYEIQKNILRQTDIKFDAVQFEENSEKLARIYEEIDAVLTNKMLKFTVTKGNSLVKQSGQMLFFTVVMSLIISLLMIVGVVSGQRFVRARMKEKEYREYILKVISENADTVFMLYNVQNKVMDYISPNLVNLIGAEWRLIQKNPELLQEYCDTSKSRCFDRIFDSKILVTAFSEEVLFKNVKSGDVQWGLVNVCPVSEADTVSQYIISIANLTEVKKTQQMLEDALLSAQSAQNASKAKSQFFSRMSHDIRTPMNAIIGMTAIAATSLDNPARVEHCLSKIGAASRHLLMLINGVLDMSKIESGKFTLSSTPFSLVEFIKSLTAVIYPQTAEKKLQFELTMGEITHETLLGDPLRLNQVLINILGNSLKFTPEGGRVAMHVEQKNDRLGNRVWLNFTISDTGIGMSPEFLERLFVPFEQEHALADSSVGGTGLGMTIVKNIITLMHGSINVESVKGEGTTFKLSVSFQKEDSVKHQPVELDALNVLVVDDDQGTCEHATIILKRIGVRAKWVLSGKEAVEQIFLVQNTDDEFDVVFIDWRMPDMDGLEVTRRIRERIGPDTLIIIISAYDWTEIEAEARLAGANAFIAKPMFQSTLYNTLLSVTKGVSTEISRDKLPDFSGKLFLLAEDNDVNAEIAVELLKLTGARIDAVVNGKEAVTRFEQSAPGTYAAILMDVQMPVLDGYQATREIRLLEHPDAAAIPIIAMTANAFADDMSNALASGMNDHISKPIDTSVMYKKIAEWVVDNK